MEVNVSVLFLLFKPFNFTMARDNLFKGKYTRRGQCRIDCSSKHYYVMYIFNMLIIGELIEVIMFKMAVQTFWPGL